MQKKAKKKVKKIGSLGASQANVERINKMARDHGVPVYKFMDELLARVYGAIDLTPPEPPPEPINPETRITERLRGLQIGDSVAVTTERQAIYTIAWRLKISVKVKNIGRNRYEVTRVPYVSKKSAGPGYARDESDEIDIFKL